jgi:hypothetical protein
MSDAAAPTLVIVPPDCLRLAASLAAWPAHHASYKYTGDATSAVLRLTLAMPSSARDVAGDLATYKDIQTALALSYEPSDVAELTGYVFEIQLIETLFGDDPTPLSDADTNRVRDFVSSCVTYLQGRLDGVIAADAPKPVL